MVFSIALSGHSHKEEYVKALFNENCKSEVIAALLYRFNPQNAITKEINIATVTLEFASGEKISCTTRSSGRGIKGHSERLALAMAINEAISKELEPFKGLSIIENIVNPDPIIFDSYKKVLESLTKVKVYTERSPCTRDGQDGTERCDKFFAELFEKVNYEFYYSIALGKKTGKEINQELSEQAELANNVYSDCVRLKDIIVQEKAFWQRIKKIDNDLRGISSKTPDLNRDDPEYKLSERQELLIAQKRDMTVNELQPLMKEKRELITKLKQFENKYKILFVDSITEEKTINMSYVGSHSSSSSGDSTSSAPPIDSGSSPSHSSEFTIRLAAVTENIQSLTQVPQPTTETSAQLETLAATVPKQAPLPQSAQYDLQESESPRPLLRDPTSPIHEPPKAKPKFNKPGSS